MFNGLKNRFQQGKNEPGADVPRDDGDGDGADLYVWLICLGLMLFSGYRSLHLVTSTLPADAQVLGLAALAALDAGALGWLAFANSTSGARHGLALLMVALDLAGVGAALLADTALVAGASPELVKTVALWVVPIVVLANVAATIAAKAMSPARKARDAESQRRARIEYERRRVLDEIEAAEREAELAMLRNRASLMRQRSAAQMYERADDEPSANGRKREMASDGAELPTTQRSKGGPKD